MRKKILQKFFLNRGINIPDLDLEKWRLLVDVGPTSASFTLDWDGRTHYYSGSGRTHLSFLCIDGVDWVDVRLEKDGRLPNDPHDYKIMWEFIKAGLDKSCLNEVMRYNRAITEEDLRKALRCGWYLNT